MATAPAASSGVVEFAVSPGTGIMPGHDNARSRVSGAAAATTAATATNGGAA
jgi:hypothetical protein